MDDTVVYRCLNCGECCGKLLIERQGVVKGLPLLPGERVLFRRELVRPGFGIGKAPGETGFSVISYQMTRAACPNHAYGGCAVWAYRPAICRAYPIVPVISQGRQIVRTFDMTCTALKEYAGKYQGAVVPLDPDSVDAERRGYMEVVKITEAILADVDQAWFFDLKTMGWVPFRSMLPPE